MYLIHATGTPPRSPLVRPGIPSRLASKPPLHGSAPLGSLSLSTLSVTEEEERYNPGAECQM